MIMNAYHKKVLIGLALVLAGFLLQAQRFQGAMIVGLNVSQVNGDEVIGFRKLGANAGVAAILPFAGKWDVTLETLFNQKGAYQRENSGNPDFPYKYTLRLNYVEVPVLVHFNDRNILTAGLGLSWGRLVSFKEKREYDGVVYKPYADSVAFNDNDFNILADIRFRLWQRLHLNLRLGYSLASIREREFFSALNQDRWTREQYNYTLSLRLIYIFNEQLNEQRGRNAD